MKYVIVRKSNIYGAPGFISVVSSYKRRAARKADTLVENTRCTDFNEFSDYSDDRASKRESSSPLRYYN